jgi:predicted DNA-binding transcriptional regulator AlpA
VIDQYIRLKRLARLLDVHPKTVERWVREGKFPQPTYVAGLPRWREAEVMVYLEKNKEPPSPQKFKEQTGAGRRT